MIRQFLKALPIAVILTVLIYYPIIGSSLGWDVRDWPEAVRKEQAAAEAAHVEECARLLNLNGD
jgi:hypothetical protein